MSAVSTPSADRRWRSLLTLGTLAYSGFAFEYATRLWAHDYFRFFPVFILATVGLAVSRARQTGPLADRIWKIEPIGWGLAIVALIAAHWLNSPWLAILSLLMFGDSLLGSARSARMAWRLLFLLLCPALGLDVELIHRLQRISSVCASRLLDYFQVAHLLKGNVLELPDRILFVEEACSGIGSVYVMVAAAALYACWQNTRLLPALVMLVSAAWWAVVTNVLRIVVIVVALTTYNQDWTSGTAHEIVGLAALSSSLLLLLSTSALTSFVFGPIPEDRQAHRPKLTIDQIWNLLTAPAQHSLSSKPFRIVINRRKVTLALSILFLASACVYWGRVGYEKWNPDLAPGMVVVDSKPIAEQLQQLDKIDLEKTGQLKVNRLKLETREGFNERERFGACSKIWDLSASSGPAIAAVDGPFDGWHDLRLCYAGLGWTVETTTVHKLPGGLPGHEVLTITLVSEDDGARASLHYCHISSNNAILPVPFNKPEDSLATKIGNRLKLTATRQPVRSWQVQLLFQHNSSLLESELNSERRLFAAFLQEVRQAWSQTTAKTSAPAPTDITEGDQ